MGRLSQNRGWQWFIAFTGWMLSPATWWNDVFVNVPLAYLAASVVAWFWREAFLYSFLAAYWGTNILGSWLLLVAGQNLTRPTAIRHPRWVVYVATILYCVVMSALIVKGIVRPIPIPHHVN